MNLDSKGMGLILEAVRPYANITNVVPSLQCISWFKDSKHTYRSSFANTTNVVPSLRRISWFKESKHTRRSSLPTLPMLYLPFNVYLDSKRVSILIEAVLPTLPMLPSLQRERSTRTEDTRSRTSNACRVFIHNIPRRCSWEIERVQESTETEIRFIIASLSSYLRNGGTCFGCYE